MISEKFLIIGSNSFSGASFVAHLLEKGHEVVGISRSLEPNDVYLPYRWSENHERFRFHMLDINRDCDEILSIVSEGKFQYIVNFAAQGMVAQSWLTPEDWYQTNVVGQVKLHDGLRKFDFIRKYVHVTTPEVYGSTEGWIKESLSFAPSTPYAVSRAACDLHLISFFKGYDFPVVFTRAANVYGPGQQLYRIVPRAILAARTGKKLVLHGGGNSVRSFIDIADVACATEAIAFYGIPGETYHISTRELISIRDIVSRVAGMVSLSLEDIADLGDERLGKDQAYMLDSTKIRTSLGWVDNVMLDDGLQKTLSWFDENHEVLTQHVSEYRHKR
jgi:dTDP-glucose 4,6-dehydratase